MKRLIYLYFLMPFICFAQQDTLQKVIDQYVIEGKTLTYVSTYDVDNKSKQEIRNLVVKTLSSDPRLSLIQSSISEDQIEGSFSNFPVDFRKYGFKWGNIAVWVLHPAFGSFTLQFKDNKYRVIIKQVKTVVGNNQLVFDFNTDFIGKDGKMRGDSMSARRSLYAFGANMNELFDMNKHRKSDTW